MFALIHLQNAFIMVFSTEHIENFEMFKVPIKLKNFKNFKFFDMISSKKTSHI